MRKVLAMAGVFVLVGSVCYGQGVTPNLAKGSKALLFETEGLFTLVDNVNEGPVSGPGFKYFLSPTDAVRGVLQLAKSNTTITFPAAVTPPVTTLDGYNNSTTVGVTVVLEHHLSMGRVSPYIGGGAGFRTASTETQAATSGNPPVAQPVIKNAAASGFNRFAVLGLVGAEVFLINNVSLSAEYQISFNSNSFKDSESTTGGTTTTIPQGSSKTLNLGVGGSGLMRLAFYF